MTPRKYTPRHPMPPERETVAYRRYLISPRTDDRYSISKGGFVIGSAASIEDAKRDIDMFADDNPRARAVRAATRGRNPSRTRTKRAHTSPLGSARKYDTTVSNLKVLYFQGYAEDVRYERAADGKPYSHIVETDAAELYLCEHATYGRCLLIVDPSGKTPLWE